jgi:hypothetical protein
MYGLDRHYTFTMLLLDIILIKLIRAEKSINIKGSLKQDWCVLNMILRKVNTINRCTIRSYMYDLFLPKGE